MTPAFLLREFFIYAIGDGMYSVRQDAIPTTYLFLDIADAISHVKGQRGGDEVKLTYIDASGSVALRQTI
jgi:hypothetical protein